MSSRILLQPLVRTQSRYVAKWRWCRQAHAPTTAQWQDLCCCCNTALHASLLPTAASLAATRVGAIATIELPTVCVLQSAVFVEANSMIACSVWLLHGFRHWGTSSSLFSVSANCCLHQAASCNVKYSHVVVCSISKLLYVCMLAARVWLHRNAVPSIHILQWGV
jgi:hypothetical protein